MSRPHLTAGAIRRRAAVRYERDLAALKAHLVRDCHETRALADLKREESDGP
jgi:hypothetical protein